MSKVTFHKQDANTTEQPAIFGEIFRLRHETFVERLEWEVDSVNGEERDQFDQLDAVHVVVSSQQGNVEGCWRALPTLGSYMLKSVFPELLQGEKAPEHENIWEISRFTVRKGNGEGSRGYMNNLTIDLVRSFWDFAQEYGVTSFVTVTTVACERLLRQLGVSIRRLGEQESMMIGKERSVALLLEVDSKLKITAH